MSRGKSIDFALERALNVTPRSKIGEKSVRFPEPSPFTTPRPQQKVSPTPQSFSEIFQPRPPLVLAEHSNQQLRQLTTTKRIDKVELGTENVALTTLRAILDHVRKKDKVIKEEESQYDYEYVYDYVEVEEVEDVTKFSPPAETQTVTGKFPTRRQDDGRKPRPKIVPRQRVVPPPRPQLTEKKQTGFVSFVTPRPQPTKVGEAVTRYIQAEDTLEIINPPILVYSEEEEEEEPSTRRVGYTYKQPENKIDQNLSHSGSRYSEPLPEEPLTPSLQSVYESPVTQSTFTNLVAGGVTYSEQPPDQPLTPSLEAAYDPPSSSRPTNNNGKVKFGFKYSGPATPQVSVQLSVW